MYTDPISDLLTRIRNANMAGLRQTKVPSSKTKMQILRVMKEKGFIADVKEESSENPAVKLLSIELVPSKKLYLKRISKPGQRIYKKAGELRPVVRGYGIAILSTSHGIMTDQEARKKNVGGEVICEIH